MGRPAGWMTSLTGRSAMKSPGAPSHRREVQREFWIEIAKGLWAEDAAELVGVSPAVGARWFRHAGGMTPFERPGLSGRYLSFQEREEIALLNALNSGVREVARHLGRSPSSIYAGVAPERCHPRWEAGLSGVGRAMEGRPGRATAEDGEIGPERSAA